MAINNSTRRGRPTTGRVKDGVLFIRLPIKDKEWVKKEVEGLLGRRPRDLGIKKTTGIPIVVESTEVLRLRAENKLLKERLAYYESS